MTSGLKCARRAVFENRINGMPERYAIGHAKQVERGLRPRGDRSVEWHFGLCLQQNLYGGWGLAERRRQRAAKIAGIAVIARDRKPNRLNRTAEGGCATTVVVKPRTLRP